MKTFELITFQTPRALAETAALAWLGEVSKSERADRLYCVALSGGRIAGDFFSAIVDLAKVQRTVFRKVHFFWADERCLPPSDEQSNYRVARERLLDPLGIPAVQIHRLLGEVPSEVASKTATEELSRLAARNQNGLPLMDMIFLGLGEDGHVASLFPDEPALVSTEPQIYRAVKNSPKPPPERITLDYPVLAAARKVWMLASGPGKESALQASLSPSGRTPFARVLQHRSDTRIFSDIKLG